MATVDLGRVTPLHRGTYSAATTYELNDVVGYNGGTYWHKKEAPTTGVAPTNTSTWARIVDSIDAETYIGRAETAASSAEADATAAQTAAGSAASSAASAASSATAASASATAAEAAAGDHEERITRLEAQAIPYVPRFGVSGVGGSAAALTRLWESAGMTATPGTSETPAASDFDSYAPFNRRKCVGSWSVSGGKAVFSVAAYEGDPDYAEDGSMGDYVAVEVTPFWYIDDRSNGILGVSAAAHPGWRLHPVCLNPDGTARPKTYLPCYELAVSGGQAVSLPGLHPAFGSYKGLWDTARTYGGGELEDYAILEPSVVDHYEWLLMTIEYATQNIQSVLTGVTGLRYEAGDTVSRNETDSNSVVVTGELGEAFVLGQTVYIGAEYDAAPEDSGAYNRITAIEPCTENGVLDPDGTYRRISFSGDARDALADVTTISSRPWITGVCSAVLGHTGVPTAEASDKYPCKYRHRENPYGNIYKTGLDLMNVRVESDDSYKLQWYYHPNLSPALYYPSAEGKPGISDLTNENYGWTLLTVETPVESYLNGFVREEGCDARYPEVWLPVSTSGGSSSTYFCDTAYLTGSLSVRGVRRRGYIHGGANSGLRCLYASASSSRGDWNYGGGLYFAQ